MAAPALATVFKGGGEYTKYFCLAQGSSSLTVLRKCMEDGKYLELKKQKPLEPRVKKIKSKTAATKISEYQIYIFTAQ